MPSKRCPACGLVNPARAQRCDCGRSFVDGSRGEPLQLAKEHAEDARYRAQKPGLIAGLAAIVIGFGGGLALKAGADTVGGVLLACAVVIGRLGVRLHRK